MYSHVISNDKACLYCVYYLEHYSLEQLPDLLLVPVLCWYMHPLYTSDDMLLFKADLCWYHGNPPDMCLDCCMMRARQWPRLHILNSFHLSIVVVVATTQSYEVQEASQYRVE